MYVGDDQPHLQRAHALRNIYDIIVQTCTGRAQAGIKRLLCVQCLDEFSTSEIMGAKWHALCRKCRPKGVRTSACLPAPRLTWLGRRAA